MPHGYYGKLLRVDLTHRTTSVEEVPDLLWRKYLGGSAMCSHFLLKELKPGIDPLGPDNILVFMTSVVNGTAISGVNRFSVAGKSPLTNGFGEAEAGGYWGPALKTCGYDGIIVSGRADKPVWLNLTGDGCEIRDASKYWGELSGEVQDGLQDELGSKQIRVLQTGVAGENMVRYAAIVNQLKHFNGRAGLGAVMGSKNLKAIVCRGKEKAPPADRAAMMDVIKDFKNNYDRDTDPMHLWGSARGVGGLQADGILPTRNFNSGGFEEFENITGQTMRDTILTNEGTCYACSVACKREVDVPELGVTSKYGGPEYETISANGSLLGIGDLKKIALSNQLLAQYVLDSISTGAVIAFAMECFENGLLTTEDTDGTELVFGNVDAAQEMIHKIGRREGIGDLLAEGVMRAAKKIGKGAEQYAMHVKGQELPMHEPRGKKSLALAYATSPTGADHMEAPHDPVYTGFNPTGDPLGGPLGLLEPVEMLDFGPKKVRAFNECQKVWSLYNCIGMCDFVGVPIGSLGLQQLCDHVNAVTGWDMSLYEMLKVGERAGVLSRIYNVREGFGPDDDTLPQRLFEPLQGGNLEGERVDPEEFAAAKSLYYRMNQWDEVTGMPSEARLAELDLLEFAEA